MFCSPLHKRLLSAAAATLMSLPALSAIEEQGQLPLDELRTFADVYNQIRVGYVEDIDDSTLLEYAIQGMLMNLDPHSVYLTKDAFEGLQEATTGEFSGLGLEVGMEDGYVTIIAPIDGSPAAEAGLQSGDVILKLGKAPVKGMSLNEAIQQMRGPAGSEIELTIGRPGESQPFEVTLVRDVIKMASVRQRWLEPGYGYIRIAQFQSATGEDVSKALQELMSGEELKGLVLDLRNNPGGVLRSSVDVAGLFMDGGKVVYTEGRLPNSDMDFVAQPTDASAGTPLVVLINSGSASASEIVAGALQDHGRAVIMGTRSFGKGSVQTILPISDSRAVKLTTALYFTPNGRSIQAEGIEPDIEVERARVTAYDTSRRLSESDLTRHLSNANSDSDARSKKPSNSLLGSDNQLYEALTLLKGLNVLGMRNSNIQRAGAGTPAES
ncbi:PDZ domain-containing protein [Seongchinamella sediminis]|uniref:PDZ domain-containing protein n=1 Tax=Seongchinamella sediminis TaxID=2283635 RepID=A0A3L7E215_9GAMM|nr:S41 family peptidase [Seongchinamella sediminis]RLQ23536.1 PDZ domain-containing protein [Seongchinamella sediminis]